jgi:hypothetical protein
MSDKKPPPEQRSIDASNSYVEGSPNLEKGDFIGGDKNVGMRPDEVIQLVEAFSKHLTPHFRDPDLLDGALQKFQNYHQALYEWKELHNALDEILNAFNQYYSQVERINGSRTPPSLRDLKLLWTPVSRRIDGLLEFSKSIRIIGKPFIDTNGELQGERWSIDIVVLRNDIEKIIFQDPQNSSNGLARNVLIITGAKPGWWNNLYELTRNFYHTAYMHLHWGDKKLRESATELYNLSETVFRRQQ